MQDFIKIPPSVVCTVTAIIQSPCVVAHFCM